MALVYHVHWESTLPLTLSLSASGNLFCPLAHPRRAPNTNFLFSDSLIFLFSDIAAPAPSWPSGDRAAELGGRWQYHPA